MIPSSLALVLLLSACQKASDPRQELPAPPGREGFVQLTREQEQLANIVVGPLEKRPIAQVVECAGRVEVPPQNLARVHAPVSGFIRRVRFLPGDKVSKGTLLATLEHPELVRLQREFLETFVQLNALEKDYQRKAGLAVTEATSERSLEQAISAYEAAKARYRGLKAELELVGISTAGLEAGKPLQTQLPLYAPVSGIISAVNPALGELVMPEKVLYEIVDPSHSHLEMQVFAKDLPLLRKGQKVWSVQPGGADTVSGHIYLIGASIDPAMRTASVHGHFDQEPPPFPPGTYLRASILVGEHEAWAVPRAALLLEGEQAFVYRKTPQGYERVAVELGQAMDREVELLSPQFDPGDSLVLQGAYYLKGSEATEEAE